MSRSESATDVLKVTLGEDLMLKQKIVDPPHWQFVFNENVVSTHDDILCCKKRNSIIWRYSWSQEQNYFRVFRPETNCLNFFIINALARIFLSSNRLDRLMLHVYEVDRIIKRFFFRNDHICCHCETWFGTTLINILPCAKKKPITILLGLLDNVYYILF